MKLRQAWRALVLAVAVFLQPAYAQQVYTLEIQGQPLSSALAALAEQTGIQVVFFSEVVEGRQAPALTGDYSLDQALDALLSDTDLVHRRLDENGSITIQRQSDPLPTKTQGSAAAEPAADLPADGNTAATADDGTTTLSVDTVRRGGIEEIIVTGQKKEERLQDVPIAISAFSMEDLSAQKIEGGFDLLKAIPNVTFSKSNYSSYNFSIRGVGTKAVSATSDAGVAISFNNVSLNRNRLFEQEYFDIERIEVMRGPQGTLYGRNATAGVVNIITAKPDMAQFGGQFKAEVGNFDARRVQAHVNFPLVNDLLAVRVAGALTKRDGYGYNLLRDESVDGRDLWSGRLSLGFQPHERLRADLVWEHFEEDDDRLRTGKQLCHRDPGPLTLPGVNGILDPLMRGRLSQGCKAGSLYDDGAFGAPNGLSIPFVVAGQLSTVIGLQSPGGDKVNLLRRGVDPFRGTQSYNLREMESYIAPEYQAKADIYLLNVDFDITDSLKLSSQTLYNEDQVYSLQDYHRFATVPTFNDSSGLFNPHSPFTGPSPYLELLPDGVFTDPQIGASDRLMGIEISSSESTQFSQELRLQSDFDGPLNFSLGANYSKFDGRNEYYLFYNVVSAIAQIQYNRAADWVSCNNDPNCVKIDPNPIGSLTGDGHNYFRNQNPFELESKAAFGELYWQMADNVKLTAGLRYTKDHKYFTPWPSQLMQFGFDYASIDPIDQTWDEFTGRLGFDWKPDLGFTDETLVYAFYSRGYKGGGANPPPAASQYPLLQQHALTFRPEYVNSFELGTKNALFGGTLILNANGFYYDYKDYQVSKVVDRTVVNENFDATVWGLEFETIWQPTYNLRFNATLGHLRTELAKGSKSIDIFDRTQGNPGWMVLTPWIQQTSNCIMPMEVVSQLVNAGFMPGAEFASPIVTGCFAVYGIEGGAYGFDPALHPEINNGAGFEADLGGNELPNAPNWTLSIGGEYTLPLPRGWDMTVRGDYYRQTESYARVYNSVSDELRGWDNTNLSLRLSKPEHGFTVELYAKNVFDKTPITDAFINSDSTGMTTNIFTLDPRLIGLSVTKRF